MACSAGTFYDAASGTCSPCPAGSYQNKEGKLNCKSCDQDYITGPPGASSRKQCTGEPLPFILPASIKFNDKVGKPESVHR